MSLTDPSMISWQALPTVLGQESAFGLAEALTVAQASIDEIRGGLESYAASKIPRADAPIHLDSTRLSVLAYTGALERVKRRFWTTTFLASGFWAGPNLDILEVNLRLLAQATGEGPLVRRLFLLAVPPADEVQRLQDERTLLRRCEDFDGLARFDQRIASLCANVRRLLQHGCEVRIVHDPERLDRRLPAELGIDPRDTEFAIYDDWRFDLFQGGLFGTIQSVRAYTPTMTHFDAYRDELACYFAKLWETSQPIEAFMQRLRDGLEASATRIDYQTNWLVRYDHALPPEDEALKIEELSGVRVDLVRLERWGRIERFLDVGTCTGRYLVSLRDAVDPNGTVLGIDSDVDCVRFTQAKMRRELGDDRRFRIERHDFASPEPPSTLAFDLITCMLGTMCHFERRAGEGPPYDDPFQRALEKLARLLTNDGTLFFSVWTEAACRDLRLLSIYSEEDKRRLARAALPRQEMRRRLESAGLREAAPVRLQDRLELYRCERSR
jgi:SAM-dependent methyltransferase